MSDEEKKVLEDTKYINLIWPLKLFKKYIIKSRKKLLDDGKKDLKLEIKEIENILTNFDTLNGNELNKLKDKYNAINEENIKEKLIKAKDEKIRFLEKYDEKMKPVTEKLGINLYNALDNRQKELEKEKNMRKFLTLNILVLILSPIYICAIDLFSNIYISIYGMIMLIITNIYLMIKYFHSTKELKKDIFRYIKLFLVILLFSLIEVYSISYFIFNYKDITYLTYILIGLFTITLAIDVCSNLIVLNLGNNQKEVFPLALSLVSFYVVLIEKFSVYNLLPKWIINSVLVVTSLVWIYSLIYNVIFVKDSRLKRKPGFGVLITEIIFVITICIYTIYELFKNNNNLFSGVINTFGALCGGVVTLAGVAWTIRYESQNKKDEQVMLHKPYIKLQCKETNIMDTVDSLIIPSKKDSIIKDSNVDKVFMCHFEPVIIKNTSNAEFITKCVILDDVSCDLEEKLVDKNEFIKINLSPDDIGFYDISKINSIKLILSDVLGNLYEYKCEVDYEERHNISKYDIDESKKLNVNYINYKVTSIGLPNEYKNK